MTHQHATLEDTVYFWFASNDTSGSGGDGATPLFDVRLAGDTAGAAPTLSGTPTLLTNAAYPAGFHEVAVAATAVNGFTAGETYGVVSTLAVDGQNPTGFIGSVALKPIITSPTIRTSPATGMNDQVKTEVTEIPWSTKVGDNLTSPTANGSVYAVQGGTTTKITAGISTSYDHGGEVGIHLTTVDSTNAAYIPEETYSFFFEGMTLGGVADVGDALATYTLRTQSIDSIYGSGLIVADYTWDTAITATDPGAGNVKANSATYSLITQIFINGATAKGVNASAFIKNLKVDDIIVIAKDKDTTKFFDGRVSGPVVDNVGWFTIPIIIDNTGDAIGNNNAVDVGFLRLRASISPEEFSQARDALGIDGDKTPAVGGQLQVVAADVENIDGAAMRGTDNAFLAANAPANFEDMAITNTTGQVTVGTNNDKTGYSISGTKTTLDNLQDLSAAQVNAEVLDVFVTDTFAEPVGVPAATASMKDMLHWNFTLARNTAIQTATLKTLRNDADTADIATASVSLVPNTSFTRSEWS